MASTNKNKGKTVNIVQINVNGFRSRRGEVEALVLRHPDCIVLINDSRLQPGIPTPPLEGKTLYRKDANINGTRSGGVIIAVPEKWSCHEPLTFENDPFEGLALIVFPPDCLPIKVATLYNHPGTKVPRTFFQKFKAMRYNGNKLKGITIGDLNAPNQLFGSRTTTPQGRELHDLILEEDLILLNDATPTFISPSSGEENLLDIALCEEESTNNIGPIWVEEGVGSDHLPLVVNLALDPSPTAASTADSAGSDTRRHEKVVTNWTAFQEFMEHESPYLLQNASCLLNPQEVEDYFISITSTIAVAKKNASCTERRMGREGTPFSAETRGWIRTRRWLNQQRQNKHLSSEQREVVRKLYNRANHIVHKKVKDEDKERERKKASKIAYEPDASRKWRNIKSFLDGGGKQRPSCPIIKTDGTLAGSSEEKANLHADRLAEAHQTREAPGFDNQWKIDVEKFVADREQLFNPRSSRGEDAGDDDPSAQPFTLCEVLQVLKKTSSKSAAGDDGISYGILKRLPQTTWEAITNAFNACLALGYFPKIWKHAKVTMLPKPGKPPSVLKNHRPISLLPCLGKVLERLMAKRLNSFLEGRKLINNNQAGFRAGRCTQEHLLRMSEDAFVGFKNKQATVAVLLDVEGAFDSVWHDGLRFKLVQTGLPDKLIRVTSSFLQDRSLYVLLEGSKSKVVYLLAGTPQGSSLSPTLYIIYNNDIPLNTETEVRASQFADDSGLWTTDNSIWKAAGRLQRSLNGVETWCCKWRVVLSPSKTQLIVFSRTPSHHITVPRIKLFGERLTKLEEVTFLGLTMNKRLTWQSHIEQLIQKAWPRINAMRRIAALQKPHHPETLLMIYNSFVRPLFEHAAVAFCNTANTHWQKLERVQNAALRAILKQPAYVPCDILRDAVPIPCLKSHLMESAYNRFVQMIDNSPLVQDLYEEHRNAIPKEAHKSPLETILEL
jgi:hypothetical protein